MNCFVLGVKKISGPYLDDICVITGHVLFLLDAVIPTPPHMTCFVVGIKKMRAEISFKMRVVRLSETVWGSSYELFCVRVKNICFASSILGVS